MKLERTKNAKKGILVGSLDHMYRAVAPFVVRTIILYVLGVEYLGLNNLFYSILQVLNLAELGIGSAMVFSMYKPIAEDDEHTICSLMWLYRRCYRVIGIVVLAMGLLVAPFVPMLVKGQVPDTLNIYVLYFLNLAATVISYWLFAYKNCLLMAHQRYDVVSRIAIVTNTILYIVEIIAIVSFKSYYGFLIAQLVMQMINNLYTAYRADKMYPRYQVGDRPDKETVKRVTAKIKDLFAYKIGEVMNRNADNLVVSAFFGLTMLAIYQNYIYILALPLSLVNVLFDSVRAGVGNSLETESREKNYQDMEKITFIFGVALTVCTSGLIAVYQNFMHLWVGKDSGLTLPMTAVVLFTINFFLTSITRLLDVFRDAGGIWHKDRFRPIVVAAINLTGNLITLHFFGIYGIIVCTVLTLLFISIPWEFYNLLTSTYKDKALQYAVMLIKITLQTAVCVGVTFAIGLVLPDEGIVWFIIRGFIAVAVSVSFIIVINIKNGKLKLITQMIKRRF